MKKLFAILLFAGVISFIPSSLHPLFSSSLIAQIPSEGLVAWYPFNGNANDESGNGHNGTVNGATLTTDRYGINDKSYAFSLPSGNISLPNFTDVLISGNLTISLWYTKTGNFYPSSPRLIDFGSTHPGIWSPEYDSNHDVINYYWPLTGAEATTEAIVARDLSWHHLVVSFHSESNYLTEVFIDGVLSATTCCTTPGSNGMNLNWLIGMKNGGEIIDQWVGKIDDVAIYSNTLEANEIQQLYQDQTGQVQQPLTCNITVPVTSICEGESVTLSMNTTGGAGSSSQLPANLQQGLVAYYPFNGNANDESGNGNNGVVNGATLTSDRFGNVNSAYSFDGVDDFIEISNNQYLTNVDEFSISIWYKIEQWQQVQGSLWFATIEKPSTYSMELRRLALDSALVLGASVVINESSWNILSIVYSNNLLSVYSNGVFMNSSYISLTPSIAPLLIGKDPGGLTEYTDGKLDDLMIYNRALSPSEIQQLYTSQSFAWNISATTNSITVTPTTNTTYSCTVTQGNSTCTASVEITVNPAVTNAISASIVEGQSYTFGTQILTTEGTYTEVFTSTAGCDSTVTLTLAVEPLLTCNITAPVTSICAGESVTLSVNTTGGAGLSSQLPSNLQQGLVAYYPFNGNANDESGNGNDGTVNGATLTSDRFGISNNAYDFNGVSDYIIANSQTVVGASSRSVSFWIKTEGNTGTTQKVILDEGGMSCGTGFAMCVGPSNFTWFDNTCSTKRFNQQINLSEWNHLVFVYENGVSSNLNGVACFLNGQLINSSTMLNNNLSINSGFTLPLTIGRSRFVSDGFYFNGQIDDVLYYNRALSPSEIQQLYTAQSFAWNTGATTPSITVTPTNNTTYSGTVTQGSQTCTASVDITVNPNVTNTITATIIEGETYTMGAQTLTTAGTYTEVFTSTAGCDSTVTLTLAVEPLLTCNITAPVTSICEGESVTLSVNTTGSAGSSSQLPANLQEGLVAYYPFNGNANDESGNGNNGAVNGATLTSDRYGNLNEAYYFNGNSAIKVPYSANYQSQQGTVSLWVNIQGLPIEPAPQDLLFGQGWGFPQLVIRDNGRVRIQVANSVSDFPGLLSDESISLDSWIHITAVYQENYFALYFNGQLESEGVSSQLVNYFQFCQSEYWIGGFMHLNSCIPNEIQQTIFAKIDDVMLYNRALSPSEIQQLYTSQSFAWNTGATTNSITVTPSMDTTYSCTVTQGNQTCTDSIAITVNPVLTWYADADGDGFGNPDAVLQDCNQPAGYVTDNTDCNDASASAFPGGEEICGNNIDEDCNGQDSICFVAVLGCTNADACNFNPLANIDDNSCVLPQPEICDGLDNNCNNQVDEGFTIPTINPVAVTPALYPVCTGNALKSADFTNGTNSPIIDGNGADLWYSFTAQFNTLRVGLSAAFGDNSIGLYTLNNGCLELITEEHEVYTTTTAATGNQILLSDQLTVGQTYYVAVHQIAGPTNTSAKVCFTYLNGSNCDHYYSNNTGVYTTVCNSFKAQYRANASNYIFNVLSGTQNGVNMNLTPWSYTNNNANSVVARLGSILPANHSGVSRVYTLAVPVVYGLPDAAGNVSSLLANATTTCTVTLNSEATIALRQADRCPATKSITATIAPDRSVCGAIRYDWEFTQVLPTPGTAQVVQGGAYASVFFLSNVPGVAAGKTYNVRVRPVHSSGVAGNWGSVQCLRIGNAGMILENHPVQTAQALVRTPLLSLRAGGEMSASYSIYPNPTATGSFVLQYNGSRRGESIFAQEPTATESTIAQEPTTTESTIAQEPTTTESTIAQEPTTTESASAQELVMFDITGKVVYQQQVVLNGSPVEIKFGDLASGVYVVMVGEERIRLIIE